MNASVPRTALKQIARPATIRLDAIPQSAKPFRVLVNEREQAMFESAIRAMRGLFR